MFFPYAFKFSQILTNRRSCRGGLEMFRNNGCPGFAPGCQNRGLMAVLPESRDLPQAKFPSQQADSLIRQCIGHLVTVDNHFVESETRSCHATGAVLDTHNLTASPGQSWTSTIWGNPGRQFRTIPDTHFRV